MTGTGYSRGTSRYTTGMQEVAYGYTPVRAWQAGQRGAPSPSRAVPAPCRTWSLAPPSTSATPATGLDTRNVQRLITAISHAAGRRPSCSSYELQLAVR